MFHFINLCKNIAATILKQSPTPPSKWKDNSKQMEGKFQANGMKIPSKWNKNSKQMEWKFQQME